MFFTLRGLQFLLFIYMAQFFELGEVCISFKSLIYIKDQCFVPVKPISSMSLISSCINYIFLLFLVLDAFAVLVFIFNKVRVLGGFICCN
jgi:hypothetical protein